MKLIPLAEIRISPDRQRRLFDAARLHEFADNIQQRGLLHPILLREVAGQFVLVAGERRLRAVTDLAGLGGQIRHDSQEVPLGQIPYTLITELDPLAYEEAELDENIHRESLTWQERAAAHSRLKALREAQALSAGTAPPSTASIALEVRGSAEGIHQETTRREIIVAAHLHNPEVAGAKSVDEAFKILKKQESSAKNRELGALVGRTFTADLHTLLNEDSLAWMEAAPAEQFDCLLTDPPYGMNADEFGDSGGLAAGAHGYEDSGENLARIIPVLARASLRITKPQAHAYVFCDLDHFHWIRGEFAAAGWWCFRTPLVWYKRGGMRAPWPEHGPQRKYEVILYAVKGKRPVLRMAADVLDYLPDTNLGHSAQKPVALFKDLHTRTCLPGNAVFDPFAGSGTIFEAAHDLKCRATGIESDQASFGIMVERVKRLKVQGELDLAVGL